MRKLGLNPAQVKYGGGYTGNVCTEDLVAMCHKMDVETGIDLEALLAASRAVQDVLGRPLGAHLLSAGPVDWEPGGVGG